MISTDAKTARLKIPPHSLEAEQSVLGGLLLDNQAWDKIVERVQEHDFHRPGHRILFRVIADLTSRGSPFDVLTLTETLKTLGELSNAGGEDYLLELARNTPTAANIAAYADIVRERSIQRQLITIATDITENAFIPDGRSSSELLDDAERKVFQIASQTSRGTGPQIIGDVFARAVERIDVLYNTKEAITGVTTGYTDLDKETSGLQKSDLIVIAGRPSMGKTAFAINIAENVALKAQKPVLVFSMEMPAEALAMRMLSSLGRIDQQNIRTGNLNDDDWPRITSVLNMFHQAPFYIDDTPALSPAEVRARARRVARDNNGEIGLIVIDYLQLMQIPSMKENRTAEISEISRSLKSIAKELSVPVIALSQLNRGLEQRTDKRPVMSDLRESGAIEQDADLILFIYRDEVYNKDTPNKGKAEIIIAKQRNGPIGAVTLTFLGRYTKFENYVSEQYG